MPARLLNVDRDTPMLLPPDLRDWVAKDDLVRFLIDALDQCDLSRAKVNERGTGDRQYPPGMMLALLIYCYAHRVFSSRQIERATYHHVSVRYLCGNLHPDHDTIATFRRENGALVEACFLAVLELAKELKAFTRLGTVSIDGSKVAARAHRDQNWTVAELEKESAQLQSEIEELMKEAEKADASDPAAPEALHEKLQERTARREALQAAKGRLEERQKASREEYHRRAKGQPGPDDPSPPSCPPRGTSKSDPAVSASVRDRGEKQPINVVEPESRLMRDAHGQYRQAYNVQLAVEAGGSQLIVGARISTDCNDRRALKETLQSIAAPHRAEIEHVLADTGYDNAELIAQVEQETGITVLCPPQSEGAPRCNQTYRMCKVRRRRQELGEAMRARLEKPENQARYRRRSATVEPVFGVLKNVMGLRRFSMFGQAKAQLELVLTAIAYNLRRLARMAATPAPISV
jgi:transposase